MSNKEKDNNSNSQSMDGMEKVSGTKYDYNTNPDREFSYVAEASQAEYDENQDNQDNKNSSKDTADKIGPTEIKFPKWFSRYSDKRRISIVLCVIIIGFIVLAVATDFIAIASYKKYDTDLLKKIGKTAIEDMQTAIGDSNDTSIILSYTDDHMASYSDIQGMEFFIFNVDGTCIMASSNVKEYKVELNLKLNQIQHIESTGRFDPSMMGISTSSRYSTYGRKFNIKTKNTDDDFYFLIYYPDSDFEGFALSVIVGTCIALIIVAVLVALVVGMQYRRYTNYFKLYSQVVQQYARDDFSVKLPIPPHTKSDYFTDMVEATNQLALNIETNEERRKQFISNVSHELRTPMTSICGFVDSILDGTIPKSEEKKYLTIVSQETRRLKNMIQSMLNLTRIESGTLRLPKSEFNLTDTAVRTLLLFENQIQSKNVEVKCNVEQSYKINGNKDYIQQVIYNLIENAVKFVNEDGKITMTVEQDSEKANYVDFILRNTGDGLSAEELPKIFDRFYKTDRSRSKDKTGLGLGLTICKRIVHLHGGTIAVRSSQGEYTEFIIKLPRDAK